ncbi:MAG: hypothetical protein V7L29_00445 [Nostoc sp.]
MPDRNNKDLRQPFYWRDGRYLATPNSPLYPSLRMLCEREASYA